MILRYANANDGQNKTRKLSVYINGAKVCQTALPALANWDTWDFKTETLTLKAGANMIAYKYDAGDDGNVNLDAIIVGSKITAQKRQ